ncbi:MAG: DNA polymerase III subunit chi [Gammaproteobacteria bacterium]|nr:DNA polymerase III subunit chi [Gammaproteobacteria bacterium]
MTRIDFYILPQDTAHHRELYACRVTEKAFNLGHHVYIHSDSAEQTQRLDDLLWQFSDGSFIPHAPYSQGEPVKVQIGHNSEPMDNTDILINLAHQAPVFFSRFERVAEIVDQSPAQKEGARERFKFYRDRGYDLQHHHIKQ